MLMLSSSSSRRHHMLKQTLHNINITICFLRWSHSTTFALVQRRLAWSASLCFGFLETGTGSLLLRRRMDSGLDGWTPFFLNEMVSTKIVFSESVWWILDCSDLFEWCISSLGSLVVSSLAWLVSATVDDVPFSFPLSMRGTALIELDQCLRETRFADPNMSTRRSIWPSPQSFPITIAKVNVPSDLLK